MRRTKATNQEKRSDRENTQEVRPEKDEGGKMSTKPKKEKGEEYIEKTRRGCTAKASNFLNEHVCQANKEQLTAAANSSKRA